jgi:hypothetical protein
VLRTHVQADILGADAGTGPDARDRNCVEDHTNLVRDAFVTMGRHARSYQRTTNSWEYINDPETVAKPLSAESKAAFWRAGISVRGDDPYMAGGRPTYEQVHATVLPVWPFTAAVQPACM